MEVQGMGVQNMQEMRAHMMQMRDFHSGKINLSESDIAQMQEQLSVVGKEVPEELQALSDSFDEIDKNGDGISVDEVQHYFQNAGMSFGPGQPPPGMFGKPPSNVGMNANRPMGLDSRQDDEDEQSYIDKLLEQYSSYDSESEISQTFSFSV